MESNIGNKFLFQLSVDEFKALHKNVLTEVISAKLENEIKEKMNEVLQDFEDSRFDAFEKRKSNTIKIAEVSTMTGLTIKTIYTKVSRAEMPVLTRGRPLIFSRKVIQKWLDDGKPSVVMMKYEEYERNRKR